MNRVIRNVKTPTMDKIREWHLDEMERITRQHVERIARGMSPRDSLLLMLRSLKLHKRELNQKNKDNSIMLEREAESLMLDRSHDACSEVQY